MRRGTVMLLLRFEVFLKLRDELFELFKFHITLLDLDLEIDILFESSIDLIRCELCETFFEEMDTEFDIEVFFLEVVDMLGED